MRVTSVSASVEMRRSNGDYGGDKCEVELRADLEAHEDPEMALRQLLDLVRAGVESDLKRSPSLNIRRGLIREMRLCNRCGDPLADEERSYLHPACREAEDAEREARHQRLKAEHDERDSMKVGGPMDDDDEDMPY